MKHHPSPSFVTLLLALSPLVAFAASPPYWPAYPPPPYYYPALPPRTEQADARAPSVPPHLEAAGDTHPIMTSPSGSSSVAEEPAEQARAVQTTMESGAAVTKEGASTPDGSADAMLSKEIATAIQRGNFAEAYYLWRPQAEAGDADAQYGIGWMYHNGYGLAIDDEEAIGWWELASRQGHIDATFALGMLFGLGEGEVRRDMSLAVSYYHLAARAGHEDARLLLRTLMAEGDRVARALMQSLLDEGRVAELTPPASVTSSKANIRKGPGTGHSVLTTLKQGHPLMPLRREGSWLLVGIKGKNYTGWIHDSLVGKAYLLTP